MVSNNLISIGWLTEKGYATHFTANGVQFKAKVGVIFGIGQKIGCMYQMRVRPKKLVQEQNC